MTAEPWYVSPAAYLWQVGLHSVVAGSIFFAWARHHSLAPGRAKRWVLCLLLLLPMVTAAIPGRGGAEFRDHLAWFDSARILGLPLLFGFRVADAVLLVAVVSALVTVWQEVIPVFRWPRADFTDVPERLVRLAAEVPDAAHYRLGVLPDERIILATTGSPTRPSLLVSGGALGDLTDAELFAALLHERAHWNGRRWLVTHALYVIRLFQCWNPAALWVFREYLVEVEVACDAEAMAGRDPRALIRVLLKVYEMLARGDIAARGVIRTRVDALRPGAAARGREVPEAAVIAAGAVLFVLLPWIV